MQNSHHLTAHLKLLGMAAVWGASWPWGRVVAQTMPPLTAASLRFLIAAMVLLLWLHARGGLLALTAWRPRQWLAMAAAAAVGVFGYSSCFMLGLQQVTASKGVLLITLNPVLTLLLAAWLFKEKLNRTIAFGMLLAVTGASLVITHGRPWDVLDGSVGIGEILLLGCAICWSVYTLIGRRMLANIDALTTTAVTAALGALMLLASSLWIEGPAAILAAAQAPMQAWGSLVALALGATALAYAWYFDGVKALGAGATAGYITLVPVFGVLFSALWLGEAIDASILLGGTLAIIGMVAMNRGRSGG